MEIIELKVRMLDALRHNHDDLLPEETHIAVVAYDLLLQEMGDKISFSGVYDEDEEDMESD